MTIFYRNIPTPKPYKQRKFIFIGYMGFKWPRVLVNSLAVCYVKGELA